MKNCLFFPSKERNRKERCQVKKKKDSLHTIYCHSPAKGRLRACSAMAICSPAWLLSPRTEKNWEKVFSWSQYTVNQPCPADCYTNWRLHSHILDHAPERGSICTISALDIKGKFPNYKQQPCTYLLHDQCSLELLQSKPFYFNGLKYILFKLRRWKNLLSYLQAKCNNRWPDYCHFNIVISIVSTKHSSRLEYFG